ncbi:uncharacterized protein LOC133736214 [Rosa rugosa]|uniref:uncharacterized protein LOC133736214 n=1 Tax=Rosa rugosa TaxID=74645 RepID=UPI002B40CA25|nr:uncharacterized protein LOC133736214 [Rosa rugosa]
MARISNSGPLTGFGRLKTMLFSGLLNFLLSLLCTPLPLLVLHTQSTMIRVLLLLEAFRKPLNGTLHHKVSQKLNFDGSVSSTGLASSGFVIRNHMVTPLLLVPGVSEMPPLLWLSTPLSRMAFWLLCASTIYTRLLVEGDLAIVIKCILPRS